MFEKEKPAKTTVNTSLSWERCQPSTTKKIFEENCRKKVNPAVLREEKSPADLEKATKNPETEIFGKIRNS